MRQLTYEAVTMLSLFYLGWALSIIGTFALVRGGFLNIVKFPVMVKNMEHVGFSPDVLPPFGVIKILIATLSLIPFTSFIGVILATGWMGGAISAHVRVRNQYFVQVLISIVIWIGFALRHQSAMHSLLGF